MALKYLGYSLNSTDEIELEEAKAALIEQKQLGTIYGADNVKDLMISGERAIAMIWSGEGLTLADEYDNLKYIVPKKYEGFALYIKNENYFLYIFSVYIFINPTI